MLGEDEGILVTPAALRALVARLITPALYRLIKVTSYAVRRPVEAPGDGVGGWT